MRELKNFFWEKLDGYFHENDTYKNENGEGILQRYLSIFGAELDEYTIPKLEGLIDQLDVQTAEDKFLTLLAYQFGNPTDIIGNSTWYRLFLSQILNIYRYKGSRIGFDILFKLIGYEVRIEEAFPVAQIYDNFLVMDVGYVSDIDTDELTLIGYVINARPIPGNPPISQEQADRLVQFIKDFLTPIDAYLIEIRLDTLNDRFTYYLPLTLE